MSSSKTTDEENKLHELFIRNNQRLNAIIKPLKQAKYECTASWSYFEKMLTVWAEDYGAVELNPDFQRGHVWTKEQQKHFIENVIRGVVTNASLTIQFNCPHWEDENFNGDLPKVITCIDGLQRLTAVSEFMKGNILPFGLTVADMNTSSFNVKNNYTFRFAMFDFKNKAELLDHYIDLNTCGTPHSSEEIARIKQMKLDLE